MTSPPTSAAPSAGRYAGARVARVEDARLLTGTGTFVDDITRPGMLHACFVRSPMARARIERVDAAEARSLPGVRAVLLAGDLNPGAHEQWHTSIGPDVPEVPRPPLADDEVRFVGDPVALVVAESRYIAEDAADLVEVDYEPLPAAVDYATAEASDATVQATTPGNVVGTIPGPGGADVEAAFESAAHVVRETFRQHAYLAVPMETRGLVVDWSEPSGELTIWAATQVPHEVRLFASRLLAIPEHHVRVIMRDTGGGFGQKVMVLREDMCLMLAARVIGRPIKWIEDRRENLMAAGQARHEHATASVAFDDHGALVAAGIDYVQDAGAYPSPWPVGTAAAVGMLFPGPYRLPRATFTVKAVFSNTVGRTAYRGPWQFESVAREVLFDIAARQLGIDPIELRRRNLLRNDELPYKTATGFVYDHVSPSDTFERALEALDVERFRREQADARAAGRYLGLGTCSFIEPTAPGYGVYGTEGATIRIEPSGQVNVYVAGGSTGNSIETTVVQLVADALGANIEDVGTIQGDTAVTPFGAGAAGSRSGSMTAGAVAETAAILHERMLAIAAHRLEAAVEDLELAESRVRVRGTPTIEVTFADLAKVAYLSPNQLPPGTPAGLEASARYTAAAPQSWTNATHVCTCEVDVHTGRVEILRYIVSEDCGPMINPAIVEGQIDGGTVQGIGGALYEHLVYDDDGNPLTTTFMDYLLPTAAEVPHIEHVHTETPGPGPGGYKGVGEGGAIGSPPAVINAVADALAPFGVTITEQPLTPSRLLALLADAPR